MAQKHRALPVFLLRALPPVSYAITAKATGFVRYRWLLFFYRKRLHQTAERTARRLFFDLFTEYLAFSPIFIYDVKW